MFVLQRKNASTLFSLSLLFPNRVTFTSDHISATTLPVVDSRLAPLRTQHQEQEQALELEGATLRDLVAIQTKQAQLSALIVDQQKMSSLPAQEPPVFSGGYLEYPTFIAAFDAIISCKLTSNKDKLYFLSKYTSGKAREVVNGFLTLNSDSGYEEACKLLADRFGNPVRVAEAFKAKLRNWPQIIEGNSQGLQELSDFLIRCDGAMGSI